jgi:glycosyltransferase involved in cell wall biosynthesis
VEYTDNFKVCKMNFDHALSDTSEPLKRIQMILIPPETWADKILPPAGGLGPDGSLIYKLLAGKYRIDVELIDPNWPKWMPFVRRHPLYFGLDPFRSFKILTGRRRVDIVVAVFESSPVVLLMLRRLFNFKPRIAIWDIAPDEEWRPRKWVQNFVIPQVDSIFLLSDSQLPMLAKKWNSEKKGITVWQHVDADFFFPREPVTHGPILAIGEDHGRDWPTLIEAVKDLDVELIIKTRRKLHIPAGAKCRIRQISTRLSFLELRSLYADCLFVVIPLSNTLNVSGVGSVLESMAMQKALVISDNPPIRDYLENGITADVVPVGDVAALRKGIELMINDVGHRNRMALAARERVTRLYSKPVFAERLATAIRQVVGEPVKD